MTGKYKGLIISAVVTLLFIASRMVMSSYYFPAARHAAIEKNCIEILRILAGYEDDFMDKHDGRFGSFDELKSADNDESNTTLDNVIHNYNITHFTLTDSQNASVFVIIAVPDSPDLKLRTFGIDSLMVEHEWIGDDSSFSEYATHLSDPNYWKPARSGYN